MRNDYTDRRNTRLATILVVIAVLWGMLKLLINASSRSLRWTLESGGIFYICLIIVLMLLTVFIVILIFDSILFVAMELLRLDVLKNRHFDYDSKSDWAYSVLIRDTLVAIVTCAVGVTALIIATIYVDGRSVLYLILMSLCILLLAVVMIKMYFKRIILFVKRNFTVKSIYKFLIAFVFSISFIAAIRPLNPQIVVSFDDDGLIKVCNSCDYDFGNFSIRIFDYSKKECIYQKNISGEDVLFAKESVVKYITNDDQVRVAQVKDGSMEKLHWSYEIDLNNIIENDGRYLVEIVNQQGNHQAVLTNMAEKEGEIYKYGAKELKKEY